MPTRIFTMAAYGDVHRRFLQSFVYHPVNTEAEALEAYRLTCEEQGGEMGSLNQLIETINATIRKYTTLEIKTGFCELTGQKYYIATNTADLKWTKNTSRYSKNEQQIFRKVFDDIVRSETGNISSIACLNDYSNVNMSKSEMSATITKFVTDGWFAEKKGRLYMGVRGASELEPFVTEVYQDLISSCPLCKKLIFWGHRCGSCPEMIHLHCLRKFFASTGGHTTCPACRARWHNWDEDYLTDAEESD